MPADHRTVGEGELPSFDPTSGANCDCTFTYNANDELIQIDKQVGELTYRKILTWTDGNLTNVSDWVKL